jgi:hypothetical protein
MNPSSTNGHPIELRDEANRLVGYYVPVPVHAELQHLTQEIAALRKELADTQQDRDNYRRTCLAFAREFMPMKELDQLSLGSDGIPLDQVLREFEAAHGN